MIFITVQALEIKMEKIYNLLLSMKKEWYFTDIHAVLNFDFLSLLTKMSIIFIIGGCLIFLVSLKTSDKDIGMVSCSSVWQGYRDGVM